MKEHVIPEEERWGEGGRERTGCTERGEMKGRGGRKAACPTELPEARVCEDEEGEGWGVGEGGW